MTLQEFKSAAGVNTLQFHKGAKGGHYCWTNMGLLLTAKEYNSKSKIQEIAMAGYTDDGYPKFQLSNKAGSMEL